MFLLTLQSFIQNNVYANRVQQTGQKTCLNKSTKSSLHQARIIDLSDEYFYKFHTHIKMVQSSGKKVNTKKHKDYNFSEFNFGQWLEQSNLMTLLVNKNSFSQLKINLEITISDMIFFKVSTLDYVMTMV